MRRSGKISGKMIWYESQHLSKVDIPCPEVSVVTLKHDGTPTSVHYLLYLEFTMSFFIFIVFRFICILLWIYYSFGPYIHSSFAHSRGLRLIGRP